MWYVIPASSTLNLATASEPRARREAVSYTDRLDVAKARAAEIGGKVYDTGLRRDGWSEVGK